MSFALSVIKKNKYYLMNLNYDLWCGKDISEVSTSQNQFNSLILVNQISLNDFKNSKFCSSGTFIDSVSNSHYIHIWHRY